MKKICMIVPSFSAKGGITTVVNGYKDTKLFENYKMNYIETYCDGSKFSKLIKALLAYINFLYVLIINKPDLVHIHTSFGASFYRKLPFVYLSSWFKIPVISHIHGSEIQKFYINASKFRKEIIDKTFNKYSAVIVLSEEWIEKFKVINTHTPMYVIKNYSKTLNAFYERKDKEDVTILFLGFITQLKGCYDLPDIIEKVIAKNKNVRFKICGSGEQEEINKLLIEKNIDNYVSFPGWVNQQEKEKYLKEADIFILPSYTEAMPMSILEAMGYGLPVVSTNVGGIPQLVRNNYNGFLCNPGDVSEISNNLLYLIENEKDRILMGKNGYEFAIENYSFENHIKRIIKLYEEYI